MSEYEFIVSHLSPDQGEMHHWLSLASLRASGGFTQELKAGTLSVRPFPVEVPVSKVSPNRQGWRARLANVERLLSEAMQPFGPNPTDAVREALAEVRSMIDEVPRGQQEDERT